MHPALITTGAVIALFSIISVNAAEGDGAASANLVPAPEAGLSGDGGVSRGVAWGDFTGDGFPDLAVANTDNGQIFLYRNINGEHFERVTQGDIANFRGNAQGVTWPDINNDGWLDLFITAEDAPNSLYLNDGHGELVQADAGALTADKTSSTQACWADFDGDGLLDVYVVNRDYQDDVLYKNVDGHTFKAVEGPWVGLGNHGRSCGWGYSDDDLLPDLYVANAYFMLGDERHYAANFFFHNKGQDGFEQIVSGEFVNAYGYSYGVSWFDYDQDGDEDIFVSNITRYGPNVLYENAGKNNFFPTWSSKIMRDIPGPVKGHIWADFDNDGDTDLFVSEGHGGARPQHAPFDNVNRYYQNIDGAYEPAHIPVLTSASRVSAGAAAGDIDRDGDIDLFIANWSGEDLNNEFYRNQSKENWFSLQLHGAQSNRQGVGAKVTLVSLLGETVHTQYKTMWLSTGYASANEPVLHFGVGEAQDIQTIKITWPSGVIDTYTGAAINQRYLAIENDGMQIDG